MVPWTVAADELPPDVVNAFQAAKRVLVYSLEPNARADGGFHGFRILGYRPLDDAAIRQQLATTLQKEVRAGGRGTLCFLPRHGVRLIVGRSIQDLVICYECGHVHLHSSGQPDRTVGIAGDAAFLDGLLTGRDKPGAQPNASLVGAQDHPLP